MKIGQFSWTLYVYHHLVRENLFSEIMNSKQVLRREFDFTINTNFQLLLVSVAHNFIHQYQYL